MGRQGDGPSKQGIPLQKNVRLVPLVTGEASPPSPPTAPPPHYPPPPAHPAIPCPHQGGVLCGALSRLLDGTNPVIGKVFVHTSLLGCLRHSKSGAGQGKICDWVLLMTRLIGNPASGPRIDPCCFPLSLPNLSSQSTKFVPFAPPPPPCLPLCAVSKLHPLLPLSRERGTHNSPERGGYHRRGADIHPEAVLPGVA